LDYWHLEKDKKRLSCEEKRTFEVCFLLHIDYNYIDSINKKDVSHMYSALFCKLHDEYPELPLTIAPSGLFIECASVSDSPLPYWLRQMVGRGQVELAGGAFYEPLFPLIPQGDLISQIELLGESIRKEFTKKVRGCVVPYSAWEPHLVEPLKKCGINYIFLDSRLFASSSLSPYQPALLEHNGKTIFALPIESSFEQLSSISPSEFFARLMSIASFDNLDASCVVIPLTTQTLAECLCKENGISWFGEFLQLVENSPCSITHALKLLKSKHCYQKGIISGNAVLNGKMLNASVKKNIFQDATLSSLYAKIFYVHSLCNQVRGDKAKKNAALEYLWKAEDASLFDVDRRCEYEASFLLQTAYRNILLAEKQTRTPSLFCTSLVSYDIDMDGAKEFLFQKEDMNFYVHSVGARVFELDIFSVYKNYTYMGRDLSLFEDHLLSKQELSSLKGGDYCSLCENSVFANNFYQEDVQNKIKPRLHFETHGVMGAKGIEVSLQKVYQLTDSGVQVQYFLKNDSLVNLTGNFVVSLALAFEVSSKKRSRLSVCSKEVMREIAVEEFASKRCDAPCTASCVSWVQIEGVEGKMKFMIELNEAASVMILPIYGQNCRENVFEKNEDSCSDSMIGTRLLFYWPIKLKPLRDTEKMVFFKVLDIKKKRLKMRG